ncbi:hypothetical protein Rsub_06350 [Raphidocelis subcapitata]|uniref:S-adenosyl-L-methionine-dependent methyltransferase n=1 Tax=Raphidocelis subcapitata TaxID=307507 RepID=A0A2V0P184_9CHLO|nr:hypothetical protein Rsub_06350 [Raphidocelis subcapitata]|eukprot:GBF93628.1 hypothetical protein Rsub_06350 [Raphidocelis subcapitata]
MRGNRRCISSCAGSGRRCTAAAGAPPLRAAAAAAAAARRRPWPPQRTRAAREDASTSSSTSSSSGSSSGGVARRPIEVSRELAAARAAESRLGPEKALFSDPWAELLSEGAEARGDEAALDVLATRYIDECLMNAVDQVSVNSISDGEYRQVVLLGDGFDARPFRLPWPPGTVLFLVAPPEAHERAEALLTAAGGGAPRVERGRLLRRVSLNLGATVAADGAPLSQQQQQPQPQPLSPDDGGAEPPPAATALLSQLERAGFRQDRLSVWALQGLRGLGLPRAGVAALLAEVANAAAFHSLVVGELPLAGAASEAENALAEAGLLGAVHAHDGADVGGGWGRPAVGGGGGGEGRGRWLFAAQQMRLSLGQMDIYEAHAEAAEAADEDFLGNFS